MKKTLAFSKDTYWAIASVLAEAEDGDIDAQCAVGERFWHGDLVHQDHVRAVYWYTRAAMGGHGYAQCCLAYAYALGDGVEKDPVQAAQWYAKAAQQEEFIAMRALAACYANGFGVKKDPTKAYDLLNKAILQYRRPARTQEGFDRP